jgi:hypothetical protein
MWVIMVPKYHRNPENCTSLFGVLDHRWVLALLSLSAWLEFKQMVGFAGSGDPQNSGAFVPGTG